MSAADVLYALSSILENPYNVQKQLKSSLEKEEKKAEDEVKDEAEEVRILNFWTCYDCLEFKKESLERLHFGIQLAKKT